MRIVSDHTLPHPPKEVWDALLDPAVLVATIPGCQRLEATGENAYAMTVTAGVAAIKGTYDGTCELTDLAPQESLVMKLQGSGAPGTIGATVQVSFSEVDGGTTIGYDADAIVGGMVGGVGQRMLTSVAKRMAKEFFTNVEDAIANGVPAAGRGTSAAEGGPEVPQLIDAADAEAGRGVWSAPSGSGGPGGGSEEFVKGVAVGAGLVSLGVVLGALLGRRR